ncbi:MAG: nucleoside 2-deoxyribosyltransferase [Hyphomicrobiaceae bacterium]|nr:nucleoside 2-deoxyribosyltransferase [Hyphomicrobiaceae bacterium]
MPTLPRKRIYLAGPEVFLPDAVAVGRTKVAVAAEAGFEGVFPLDASLALGGCSKREQGRRIALACEAMMRSCDLAVANLTPFRGVSMDSGTAYEVGYMRALGRPVLGYSNVAGDIRGRALAYRARGIPQGDADRPDLEVEDFGEPENLMIAIAIVESGGTVWQHDAGGDLHDLTAFRRCLAEARRLLPA